MSSVSPGPSVRGSVPCTPCAPWSRPLSRAVVPSLPLSLLVTLLAVAGLSAQGLPAAPAAEYTRGSGSLSFLNTQPVGELTTGPGWGISLTGEYALDARRIFRLHGVFRGAIYDYESRQVCFSQTVGCRIVVDLETNYSLAYFGLGPQLVVPLGPVRVVADATAGWGGFFASSSLRGIDEEDNSFGNTTHQQDGGLAWSTGGELRVGLGQQLDLSVGARYQHNGRMSYVREGDITDHPDGSIGVATRTSQANLVALTIGLAFRPRIGGGEPPIDPEDKRRKGW